ncbi:MAG TPA: ADP-heptose--LPS heptosyltransferase, partial [Alphaproteobacteria bacterium]|nr:ADP-heptose--LPS heptosyltransferase [Alphaproteobacteria bacterium]
YAELGHACGYFDEILPIGRPAKRDLSGLWRLIRALRQGRFDRVYDLQTSTRSSFYR